MIQEEGLRWKAVETAMFALKTSEKKKRLGLVMTKAEMKKTAVAVKEEAAKEMAASEFAAPLAVPTAKDGRNVGGKNCFTMVKDQGGCGSCVTFGTRATIEANMRIKAQDHTLDVHL